MAARRGLLVAALLCAAGAGLVILAAGRRWAGVEVVGAGTPIVRALTGRDLAGPAAALGLAGLGGLAALLAVRGRARTAVGAVLAAFGAGAGYNSITGIGRAHVLSVAADQSSLSAFLATDVHIYAWWAVSVAGGALLVGSGLLTIVRGRRWPGMSARYEAPRGGAARRSAESSAGGSAGAEPAEAREPAESTEPDAAAADPSRLWQALDRGEDPTAGGGADAPTRAGDSRRDR